MNSNLFYLGRNNRKKISAEFISVKIEQKTINDDDNINKKKDGPYFCSDYQSWSADQINIQEKPIQVIFYFVVYFLIVGCIANFPFD